MDLQSLEPLVGEWATEARFPDGTVIGGVTTFAWLEGGGHLVQRSTTDDPLIPRGVMVLGPWSGSGRDGRIVQHYFDSRGVARVYDVGLEAGVLRLSRDDDDFAQRYEGRLDGDGAAIRGAWEMSRDHGATWAHDFELDYLRRPDRVQVVRDCFRAYETGDRALIERHLADDLVFSAPPDVGIDRATYFERCWPGAEGIAAFAFVRLGEVDGEVVATYEATGTDGRRFRNTEVFGFGGEGGARVRSIEVYFGWDVPSRSSTSSSRA